MKIYKINEKHVYFVYLMRFTLDKIGTSFLFVDVDSNRIVLGNYNNGQMLLPSFKGRNAASRCLDEIQSTKPKLIVTSIYSNRLSPEMNKFLILLLLVPLKWNPIILVNTDNAPKSLKFDLPDFPSKSYTQPSSVSPLDH